MRDRGSWVTPLLEGKPWLEKPPLYYWMTIPVYSLGHVSETYARLGPSLCALIAAAAILWLGSSLWPGPTGLIGASVLITSIGFAGYGRSATTDMPFTCCFTISMAIFAAAARKDLGWRVLAAYAFLALAVLGKGPVAIVLAVGIGICTWFLDESQVVAKRWKVVPGMFLVAALSLPWFWMVFSQNGFGFIATFFVNHNIARYLTGIHHHSQPVYYYLPALVGLLLPWSGWLVLLISGSPLKAVRRWRQWDPSMLFLGCWVLFPLVFFSFSDSKLAGYILPSIPPLALLFGIGFSRAIEGGVENSRLKIAAAVQLLFSTAMAIAVPIFFNREYGGSWKTGLLISAAAWIPALISFGCAIRGKWVQAFGATVLQGLMITLTVAQFAFPLLGAYHSTKDIAATAMEMRQPGEPIITYRFFHHSLHYYTGYQVEGQLTDSKSLVRYAGEHPTFLVVTNVQGMAELSRMKGIAVSPLGSQGDFRLVRVSTTE